jgi:hypothetical protein
MLHPTGLVSVIACLLKLQEKACFSGFRALSDLINLLPFSGQKP